MAGDTVDVDALLEAAVDVKQEGRRGSDRGDENDSGGGSSDEGEKKVRRRSDDDRKSKDRGGGDRKKNGDDGERWKSSRRKRSRSGSRDRSSKKRKRSGSREKRRRSSSRDKSSRRRRSPSPRRGGDHHRRRMMSPRSPIRTGGRRLGTDFGPPRVRDDRNRERSPFRRDRDRGGGGGGDRRRLSPHITTGGRRLPGPERRDVMPFSPKRSPPPDAVWDMSLEDRDARTVFILQIARHTEPRDLEEFFSSVGHVRDVRIITDSKTRRSKGIAYVEFWNLEAVPLALGLNGQRLLGAPLVIQPTMAERNRAAQGSVGGLSGFSPSSLGPVDPNAPLKLFIGSLHNNITEDMLRGIFEPFGRIDEIELAKNPNGASKGYGYVTFNNCDDGKRAMEQLNGFELAGRPIKVGTVMVTQPTAARRSKMDIDSLDSAGVDLGTSGRLQLMAKLAEGTGMRLPEHAQNVLQFDQEATERAMPSIATQCFMLSNMFDPSQENAENWDQEIRDDVIEECTKNGGVLYIFVDQKSAQGNVYVKCPTIACAVGAVNSLHGRWFAGKVITANYVPVVNFHQLFPDARTATALLQPGYRTQTLVAGQAGAIY